MGKKLKLSLSAEQRHALEAIAACASEPAGFIRRARVVLLSAEGVTGREIAARLGLSAEQVSRIRARFLARGAIGLAEQPRPGRRDHAVPPDTVKRIVTLASSPPPAGRSRWTTRLLGKEFGLTSGCVSDVLRRSGVRPQSDCGASSQASASRV